jgi:hypothetical protein
MPVLQIKCLNRNPLDLVQRDVITGAGIQLRRTWRLVRSNGLRILDGAAGFLDRPGMITGALLWH